MKNTMEKFVITGASSGIGINFIKYLLTKDSEVLAIVRKDSPRNVLIPKSNKVKIIKCNLNELCNLEIKEKCDIFVHLGWQGPYVNNVNNVYIQNENVKYTLDAVNLAKRIGCMKFIGAGSQAEYGRIDGIILPKTPTKPETGYGIAKLCAGNLSRLLANELGIEHIWARIVSTYGSYEQERTMIMSSIKQMLENESPEYTKAEQMWDYLYTEDMARALYLMAKKGINNSIYCVGSGKSRKLIEYIEEIKNQINPELELKIGEKEYAPNQVMNLRIDISDLTKDTGFTPEIEFEEGIRRTIEWYKGEKNEKN